MIDSNEPKGGAAVEPSAGTAEEVGDGAGLRFPERTAS